MKTISYRDYLDKVHGCWYGKCLGGAAGAPVEGIKRLLDVADFTDIFNLDLPNDDLDLQLLWLDTMERKGTLITGCDLADAWVEKCWYPFSEYGYFLKNYMRGVKPPYSGIINNSFFKEGMGCPIRSEIWGILAAGSPALAADYAKVDATLDHADNSVYAEQFLAAAEAIAFFESDMMRVVQGAIKFIPQDSKLAACFALVLGLYRGGEATWQEAREKVLCRFGHPDFTNVTQNLGFTLIALLWGKGDMRDTINIALRCGFDTDCTCASAASIVGILKGYAGLGSEITDLIRDYFIIGIDVTRPSNSIRDLAADCVKLSLSAPNFDLTVTDLPTNLQDIRRPENFRGISCETATPEGLRRAISRLKPVEWKLYGPFFHQLNQPMNPDLPSPHGEGCVLPDLVCMVNNEVFLDRAYLPETPPDFSGVQPAFVARAYEDFIPFDDCFRLEGQVCGYAVTEVNAERDVDIYAVIGNNDGYILWVNGEEVQRKDEIRLWTPYNNSTKLHLHEGKNTIVLKLLRRTEKLKFSFGLRRNNGRHWHCNRWYTDYDHID